MDEAIKLNELRELFLSAPESDTARMLGVAASVGLAILVLILVRRRALREEYTPIWIAVSAAMLLVTMRMDLLFALTRAIGAWTPSSTVFFLGEVFLLAICLSFAVRLSRTSAQIARLGQEVALLRSRLDERGSGSRL